ncbi:GTP-binding protein Obg/CgtA [Metschnikowia bicuspidata]|uniref:GTP-binding protein Obg/CgtA n=1 Tax=Metschnikowia bicuspidata TaxID=27322 RepID=A0A4P9ZG89_9ASCO|nr:GTP-binding protein Obg/CgtA [Metschnikowia bicuspidata]
MFDYVKGDQHHTHKIFNNQHHSYKQGQRIEQRTFVDLKMIRIQTGKGGNGCVSFFRDANRAVGPPDGGDGGMGGNIYISVVNGISSLHRIKKSYVAGPGKSGHSSQLDGKRGDDVVIEVPVGTTIRWIPKPVEVQEQLTKSKCDISKLVIDMKLAPSMDIQLFRGDYKPGEGWMFKEKDEEYHRDKEYFNELDQQVKDYDREIIAEELMFDRFPLTGLDFSEPTEKPVLLLRGGRGGIGNMHFLTQNVRNPRFSKRGRLGLDEFFLLELKLIADLGLVGLPNAGKLTLLQAISKARPQIGHWEFTTLQPTVGTIFTKIDQDPITVADIPGIINGASQNKGQGLDFLRHIERSGGLAFVISLDSEDVAADLHLLIDEVGEKRMKGKKVMIIATKADLTTNGILYTKLRETAAQIDPSWTCIPVCAPKGQNIEQCIYMMRQLAQLG